MRNTRTTSSKDGLKLEKRINLKTKYQICSRKVYLQEVQGTCSLVFPQSSKRKQENDSEIQQKAINPNGL